MTTFKSSLRCAGLNLAVVPFGVEPRLWAAFAPEQGDHAGSLRCRSSKWRMSSMSTTST